MKTTLIKNNVQNYIKKYLYIIIPTFIFFLIVLIVNFLIPNSADDGWFYKIMDDRGGFSLKNIFEFCVWRNQVWSSRMGIEFFLVIMVRVPVLFRILNSLFATLILVITITYFREKRLTVNLILCLLLLGFNRMCFYDAGITATNLNYLWPIALSMFSVIFCLSIIKGEKIKNIYLILSFVPLLLISLWSESLAIILVIYYLFVLIYCVIKNKKINLYLCLLLCFSLGFAIFSFISPGNIARRHSYGESGIHWYQISRAMANSMMSIANINHLPSILLFIVLPIYSVLKNKKLSIKILSIICSLIMILYTILRICPVNSNFYNNCIYNGRGIHWFAFLVYLTCFVFIAFQIWISDFKKEKKLIVLCLYACALISVFIPGITVGYYSDRSAFVSSLIIYYIDIVYLYDLFNVFDYKKIIKKIT